MRSGPRIRRPAKTGAAAGVAAAVLVLAAGSAARGAEVLVGYQLGAQQAVNTTVTSNQGIIAPSTAADATSNTGVTRLQGVQFVTNVSGSTTFDLVTRTLDHALLLGG